MHFTVTTPAPGPLSIHDLLQRHADSLWIPDHLTPEQAAAFVLDHFKRQVAQELERCEIRRV